MKRKTKLYAQLRTWLMLVLILASCVFMYFAFKSNMLVFKYLVILGVILLLIIAGMYYMMFNKKISQFNKITSQILCLFLCGALILGSVVFYKGLNLLDKVTENSKDLKTTISVVALKDSDIEDIKDVDVLGKLEKIDTANTEKLLKDISDKEKHSFTNIHQIENYDGLGHELLNKQVEAIVLNEAFRTLVEDKYAEFSEKTEVIYTYEYSEEAKDISKDVSVTKESFNVFVSGIDVYGDISQVSRSDVNMIVTVNPKTKEILLTNIPRDYYVEVACEDWVKDKLTHAGNYGPACSVETVEKFTGLELNYYVRVNFSSVMEIVDALGGVRVWSDYEFSRKEFKFNKGWNDMSGTRAMWFARERYAFGDGDHQRIKNHQYLLDGIIRKITSPAILTHFDGFLDAVGGSFETNFSSDEISAFIAMQLDNNAKWIIKSQTMTGSDSVGKIPGFSQLLAIVEINQDSIDENVNNIKKLMERTEEDLEAEREQEEKNKEENKDKE